MGTSRFLHDLDIFNLKIAGCHTMHHFVLTWSLRSLDTIQGQKRCDTSYSANHCAGPHLLNSCHVACMLLTGCASPVSHWRRQHCAESRRGIHHMFLESGVVLRQPWRCVRLCTQTKKPSRKAWGCQAASTPQGQPDRSNAPRRSPQAEQAMESLTSTSKIGSEYGEVGDLTTEQRRMVQVVCHVV